MPRLAFLPVSYSVAGRRVALIGDGENLKRKLRLLLRSQASIALFARDMSPELAALASEHEIQAVSALPSDAELGACALAFVATTDDALASIVAEQARRLRVPVNVVDRPALCDFAVPSIVDRAPVSVAIATDGTSPVLAQRVRAMVERLLPASFGRIAELAAELRPVVRARIRGEALRRDFWARLFDGSAARAALDGDTDRARREALSLLPGSDRGQKRGRVVLVGAGPGSPDLLTLRALRALESADVIVHDDLVPPETIDMGRRDALRVAVGKRKGRCSMAQEDINDILVRHASDGATVVRLKSGDPLVFGRAGEEMSALRRHGIEVDVVPGVTAALAAGADLGISLTRRFAASQLVMVTGHGADGEIPAGWEALAAQGATIALYMGRSVADRIAARLLSAGCDPALPAVAVENAGRPERRILAGTLSGLGALARRHDIDGPVMVLIGEVVDPMTIDSAERFAPPALLVA